MCVTLGPATLSGTRIYAGQLPNGRHVLGYTNIPVSGGPAQALTFGKVTMEEVLAGGRSRTAQGGANAMVLPIPARTLSDANLLDTSGQPHLLRDMEKAARRPLRHTEGIALSRGGSGSAAIQTFDCGIYSVVLARLGADVTTQQVASALKMVPEAKRPDLSEAFLDFYQRAYPDWFLAICCFNNTDVTRAPQPLLWTFESLCPDDLFMPGLDAHDGRPPAPGTVLRDHMLLWGTDGTRGEAVDYTHFIIDQEIEEVLPTHVIGESEHGRSENGDWWLQAADAARGSTSSLTVLSPPGLRGD